MRKTSIVIAIIYSVFLFRLYANTTIQVHPEDNRVILEEVFINLAEYDLDVSSGNSLFIRLEETYNDKGIITQWDEAELKVLMKKEGSVAICSGGEPIYLERLVYNDVGGSASEKISKEIKPLAIDGQNHTILEIPICSDNVINDDEIIQLYNLPILFAGNKYTRAKLQIGSWKSVGFPFGKTPDIDILKSHMSNIDWQDIDYFISKTSTKIELMKNYKVVSSKNPFNISLKLIDEGPRSFTSNREITFTLDNGALWDENTSGIIVQTEGVLPGKEYEISLDQNNSSLIFIPKNDVRAKEIIFENLPVIYSSKETEARVSLFSKFNITPGSQEKDLNFFKKILRKLFHSKNIKNDSYESIKEVSATKELINIYNINFKINHSDNGVYSLNYKNDENIISLPPLEISQTGKLLLTKGQKILIIIPDSIDLSWVGQQSESDKFKIIRKSGKILELSVNHTIEDNRVILDGLNFENPNRIVEPFHLKLFIHGFENNNLTLSNPISIGYPDLGIENPLYIYTSTDKPSVESFYIRNNGFIVPGDSLVINLSSSEEIYFKTDKKYGNYSTNELEVKLMPQKIIVNVLEDLPMNKKIFINEIFLAKLNSSEKAIHPRLEYIPGQYQTLRKRIENISSNSINIISLEVDFTSSKEYINNIDIEHQVYDLPEIKILNNSELSTPEFESLFLSFSSIDDYFVIGPDIIVSTNQNLKKPGLERLNDKISLKLNRSLKPFEEITITGLRIKLSRDEPSFQYERLTLGIEGSENLNIKTIHTIGYGIPRLISIMDQKFYADRQHERLYELTVNLKQLPQTAQTLDQIILRIPDNIDITWEGSNTVTVAPDHSQDNFKSQSFTSNNRKELFIPLVSIPENFKKIVHLGNLYFEKVGNLTDDFFIELSLDNGKTFTAKDENTKKVISQKKMSDIIPKEINEKWFPFKKGNQLVFTIPKTADFEWDPNITQFIYHKLGQKFYSKMFSPPKYSKDRKRLSFAIMHDQTTTDSLTMNFGQQLRLSLKIKSEKNIKNPDIMLTFQSIYGVQELKNGEKWKDILFKIKRMSGKRKHDIVDLSIRLEDHPDYDNEIIQWYLDEENLLNHTSLDNQGPGFISAVIDEKKKVKNLEYIKKELERHYSGYKDYIEYDWIFWYYLGRYKYEMENIKGDNYIHTFNEEEMNENKYWNDIEKAMAIGYSAVEKNLWSPVIGSTKGQDKKIFENIYSFFKNGDYVRADSILFKELYLTRRLDDTDSEYEVAVRFLDAVISECIFKDTLKLRKERTYVKHQKQEIARLVTYDSNMNDHLNNFNENYSYLAQIKAYNDSIDCSEYPDAVYDDYALDTGSSTSFIDTLSITLLHEKPKYVEKYELKLKTKESIPQSEDAVTTEHNFGENVTLSPGKTLDILYKPKDQTFVRAVSMMCASTLFIIILLL